MVIGNLNLTFGLEMQNEMEKKTHQLSFDIISLTQKRREASLSFLLCPHARRAKNISFIF